MKIIPYQTIYGEHTTYRCKARLDDGRVLDLKGAKDTDWKALAELVSIEPEPLPDPVEILQGQLSVAQAETAAITKEVGELAAVLKIDPKADVKTSVDSIEKIMIEAMKTKAVADAISAAVELKPVAEEMK